MSVRPFLAIDVGNTRVKLGVWDGVAWTRIARAETHGPTAGEWRTFIERELDGIELEAGGISSVVPEITDGISEALAAATGLAARVIAGTMRVPAALAPFRTEYQTPETLGADRLAVAAAAYVLHGRPAGRGAVAIDAGTAITIDAVTPAGAHLGGAIVPGPMALVAGLARGTAQLPAVPFVQPASALGRTTVESIQSGVTNLTIDGLRDLVSRIAGEAAPAGEEPVIVATGGWAAWLSNHLAVDVVSPERVLDGVRLLVSDER